MKDLSYLKLLSKQFPNARKAGAEIINLRAICGLPKGTEYFFSDLHGEYTNFSHLLRSASGIIRAKIEETFGNVMSEKDQLELANLIYYPQKSLSEIRHNGEYTDEWQKITINRLIIICRAVSSKYTRSKVRKKMPADYAYSIDELLHLDPNDKNKRLYYQEILNSIVEIGAGNEFIKALCDLIQNLTIDVLHIIGDIFDRGPRADLIMEELMQFHDVDIQWGNHDVNWMGAAAGCNACIANVLRIATSYNSFDVLEDGYGINLRPLSMYAAEVYHDDPCECFRPHLLDTNEYDSVVPDLAAKMCKAISVIQLKLEGQIILRHPEFNLSERLLLDKINFDNFTVNIKGKEYPLKDKNLPTIDPKHPYELTKREKQLMETLRYSFLHSQLLQKHIRFIYSHGSMYSIFNGNLLYHGCIPMDEKGEFLKVKTKDGTFSGRTLMDYCNECVKDAYFINGHENPDKKQQALDTIWYMWCGPNSPLFGKDRMTTFERLFLSDKALTKESFNPYYEFSKDEAIVDKILMEFGLTPCGTNSRIINGHVPVKVKSGESPVKANGKLIIIDGGISKAYQTQTGIAGYTLIASSRHISLAAHKPFVPGKESTPEIQLVEHLPSRVLVRDTDTGRQLMDQIDELKELLAAYKNGLIQEH